MVDLIDDSVNAKESQVSFCGLKLTSKVAGSPKFSADKLYNMLSVQKIIEGFTPIEVEHTGLSKNEIMLTSLEILGYIFD